MMKRGMSSSSLSGLSCAVLALVGRGGATTPELVEMGTRGSPFFWTSGDSQIYAEAKRLVELGYLAASKQPGKTRSRTRYELTPVGIAALRGRLAEPAGFPRIQHEASFRLFAGDLIEDDAAILESLEGLRAELGHLEELLVQMDERAALYPHRERYIRLQLSLGRRMVDAHRDWLDEIDEALAPGARDRTVG